MDKKSIIPARHDRQLYREKNPKAAQPVVGKIYTTAQTLRDHPLQGRSGRVRATRELVLADYPYIIV